MGKSRKAALSLYLAALLLAGPGADVAEARGRHSHSATHHRPHYYGRVVVFAAPFYAVPRYYYPAPVYYAPPPVYIEQPQAQGVWYYCADTQTYYPYVQSCASGWQRVLPRPN